MNEVFSTNDDLFKKMEVSKVGYGRNEYKTSKPNILNNSAFIEEVLNVSKSAETAIAHTIGPYGNETLIQSYIDDTVPVYPTRDGYNILKRIKYTQPIPNAIYKIITEPSEFLQNNVGDSTSSTMPIQTALLNSYIYNFNDESKEKWTFSPVGIKNVSYICVEEILKGITDNPKYQKKFNLPENIDNLTENQKNEILKWLTYVATISVNNDYELGSKIANLYKDKLDGRGDVFVTLSPTEEEYTEETNAFIIPVGLIDHKRMSNTKDGLTCEFENPVIALFDGQILENDIPAVKQIIETAVFKMKRPIVLAASSYTMEFCKYLIKCLNGQEYNENGEKIDINNPNYNPDSKPFKVPVAAITVQNKTLFEQEHFTDLCLMVDAKPFSTELTKIDKINSDDETVIKILDGMFGHCDKVSLSYGESLFFGCKPDKEKFDRLVKDLETKYNSLKRVKFHKTDYNQADVLSRINRLESKTTFFYCGGKTEKIKYSRKLLIDDAVSSVKAAIVNDGISIGGNMSICHYIHHNFDNLVEKVIDSIGNKRINISAAAKLDKLSEIVEIVLQSIEYSFGQAYRYALYNMYRNEDEAIKMWSDCVESEEPTIYNIMTNEKERFNPKDVNLCTKIIVPKNTDECLLYVIVETVCSLINIENMITLMAPNMDVEQLHLKQLETGAAYKNM